MLDDSVVYKCLSSPDILIWDLETQLRYKSLATFLLSASMEAIEVRGMLSLVISIPFIFHIHDLGFERSEQYFEEFLFR